MNDRLNALKEYMDFYSRNFGGTGRNGMGAADAQNWAQSMMKTDDQRQMMTQPDFFGGGGDAGQPAYVAPERYAEPMPQQRQPRDRMRPQIHNFLSQLLGGR